MIAGIGMLSVGTLGAAWLGYVQDVDTSNTLKSDHAAVYEKAVANTEAQSFLGLIQYQSVDDTNATEDEKAVIATVQDGSKKTVLRTATVLPIAMCVAYILLMMYFNSQGGYKTVELMTGGPEAAAPEANAATEEAAADETQ